MDTATLGSITNPVTPPVSARSVSIGRVLSGFGVVFLLFDGATKLLNIQPVQDSMVQLGYPVELAPVVGAILLLCVALYLVPRTAVPGALLLTGFLGGAVASHLRVGNPLLTHTLFPIYIAMLIWGGLYLRDRRLRNLFAGVPAR